MRFTAALSAAALLQPVWSLSLLVPLYIYPGSNAVAWQPLISAITKYPAVQFEVIVNPNSGPNDGNGAYPSIDYINAVAQLNSYKNVKTIGYVDTAYTAKPIANVTAEINLYAGWSKYTAKNISVSGIFFDDGQYDGSASSLSYLSSISTTAYKAFSKPNGKIVYNPGTTLSASYFQYVDTIVEFEGALSAFNGPTTIATFQPNQHPKDAVIVHDAKPPTSRIQSFITNNKNANIGFVFMTSDCCYNALNGTLISALAAQIGSSATTKRH